MAPEVLFDEAAKASATQPQPQPKFFDHDTPSHHTLSRNSPNLQTPNHNTPTTTPRQHTPITKPRQQHPDHKPAAERGRVPASPGSPSMATRHGAQRMRRGPNQTPDAPDRPQMLMQKAADLGQLLKDAVVGNGGGGGGGGVQ